MSKTYTEAPDLRDAARELIERHHQHLVNPGIRLLYRFCDKTDKQRGRPLFGKVKILSDLEQHLYEGNVNFNPPDEDGKQETPSYKCILMVVSKPEWRHVKEEFRPAFVDDLLSQIEVDYDEKQNLTVAIRDEYSVSINPAVAARHPDYGNAVIVGLQRAIGNQNGQLMFRDFKDPEATEGPGVTEDPESTEDAEVDEPAGDGPPEEDSAWIARAEEATQDGYLSTEETDQFLSDKLNALETVYHPTPDIHHLTRAYAAALMPTSHVNLLL